MARATLSYARSERTIKVGKISVVTFTLAGFCAYLAFSISYTIANDGVPYGYDSLHYRSVLGYISLVTFVIMVAVYVFFLI